MQEQAKTFPFYLANEPVYANEELLVTDKYTNKVAYKVAIASLADIDRCQPSFQLIFSLDLQQSQCSWAFPGIFWWN